MMIFDSLSYGKQIWLVLFPIMMVASILASFFIPEYFQLYFLASFLSISIGMVSLIYSRSKNDVTNGKLDELIRLIKEKPMEQTTPTTITQEELSNILKEYEIVIRTQMHFNDLIIKVRSATVSVVLAVFGAAAYSLQFEKLLLDVSDVKIHASAIVTGVGILILVAMFIIDYRYYFRMLRGAVERGYDFDDEFSGKFKNISLHSYFGMTKKISSFIGKKDLSKFFVIIFYLLPIIGGIIFFVFILVGYH